MKTLCYSGNTDVKTETSVNLKIYRHVRSGSYLSTCIQSYKNDNKKQAIIVWDIENIQPPNISIHDLISYIRLKFITKCGYIEHSTICSLTNISIKKLDASTLDELISVATCILLASTYSKKRDADFVLLRELMRFISHNNPKQSKIILITGDSDYFLFFFNTSFLFFKTK